MVKSSYSCGSQYGAFSTLEGVDGCILGYAVNTNGHNSYFLFENMHPFDAFDKAKVMYDKAYITANAKCYEISFWDGERYHYCPIDAKCYKAFNGHKRWSYVSDMPGLTVSNDWHYEN